MTEIELMEIIAYKAMQLLITGVDDETGYLQFSGAWGVVMLNSNNTV